MSDPARLVLRALHRSAAAAGCTVHLAHESLTPWASVTFTGGQHRIAVTGDVLDAWLAMLPDADLPMPGHFVASCEIVRVGPAVTLTLLVLEA